MKSYIQRILRLVSVVALFVFVGFTPATVHAVEEAQAQPTATQSNPTNYTYTAKAGDALTVFVRRSLQLHQTANKVELSRGAAMYCETTITQAMGNARLEIGQQVTIPVATLTSCVEASKGLSEAQVARWQAYADTASYDLEEVQPNGAPTSAETPQPQTNNENTTSGDTQEPSVESETETATENPEESDDNGVSSYWWLIGAGLLVLLYFILGGPAPRRRA